MIVPIPAIAGVVIHILLVVVFWIILQRAEESKKQGREIAAIAVFSIMLIFGTVINNIFTIFQNMLYARTTQGAPVMKFSMLLLIIYAAVMLGRKEK